MLCNDFHRAKTGINLNQLSNWFIVPLHLAFKVKGMEILSLYKRCMSYNLPNFYIRFDILSTA